MPIIVDTTGIQAAPYDAGQKNERVTLTHNWRGDTLVHGTASFNGAATLRAANKKRMSCIIYNDGSVTIWVGASGVLTTDGLPVLSGGSLTLNDGASSAIFVNSAAAATCRFLEEHLFA